MNFLENKIEQLQKKPEHERRKIFWTLIFVLVPIVTILGVWLIFLSIKNVTQDGGAMGDNSTMNSLESLIDGSQKNLLDVKDSINNFKSVYSTDSTGILSDPSNAPQNTPEENKVYFISPAPSTS